MEDNQATETVDQDFQLGTDGTEEKKVMMVAISLPVPNYPYPLEVKVPLTFELEMAIRSELDERRQRELMNNVIFNMLTESMMAVATQGEEKKSNLILP